MAVCEKAIRILEAGTPVRKSDWSKEEFPFLRELQLITQKPVLYAANVLESELPNGGELVKQVKTYAEQEGSQVVVICGKVEAEVAELSDDEAKEYLKEFGLQESGLNQLIRSAYVLLGLITFLTAGEKEVRAWTVLRGATAPKAAGVIHSDFERGFIRAEVMAYDDLMKYGTQQAVKEKGLYRVEGKEYLIKDGDIVYFRFNV